MTEMSPTAHRHPTGKLLLPKDFQRVDAARRGFHGFIDEHEGLRRGAGYERYRRGADTRVPRTRSTNTG